MRRPGPRPILAATAGLAFLAAQLDWWTVAWAEPVAASASLSGAEGTAGLAAVLPAALAAGLLLTTMLDAAGRRTVGVLLAALAAGMAALGLVHPAPADETIRASVPAAALASSFALDPAPAAWAYGALGAAGVAASGFLVARPGTRRPASASPAGPRLADTLASWKAMDAGHDPTDDRSEQELP